MTEQLDLATRLRTLLAHYDDDALAALANRGLLRRAMKDLESATITVLGEEGGKLRVDTGETVVSLGDPVHASTCTCPAGGVCRHILLALLHLRAVDEAPPTCTPDLPETPTSPPPDAMAEMLAVTDEMLKRFAGTPLLRRARQLIIRMSEVEITEGPPIVVALPALNISCRWFPGGGLEGMVCTCHVPGACEHRVAAVLAVQAANGMRTLDDEATMLVEPAGAPRSREEVLASVGDVLTELVGQGFSRASQAIYEELQTLAVSAHGVDLPRLERLLNTLADEVRLLLSRDARADTRNLLRTAATVEALRSALAHPTAALVGVHRTRYDAVGQLELMGVGAGRWRTRSGFHGLTVYFWDVHARQWATWTDARPLTAAGDFDPVVRFRAPGPWTGSPSVMQASHSRLRATGAWRNTEGRLSGREAMQTVLQGESDLSQGPPTLTAWPQVAEQAQRYFRPGLCERDSREALVLLMPVHWERADYDEVRQELTRVIRDNDGRELTIWLPFSEETKGAITLLEAYQPGRNTRVFGTLRLLRGRIVVEPITVHDPPRMLNLTLDEPKVSPLARLLSTSKGWRSGSEEDETAATPIGVLLEALLAEFEVLAETGISVRGDFDHLERLLTDASTLGLDTCATAGRRLLTALARRQRAAAAIALLQAGYIIHLAITTEALLQATEGLT